MYKKEKREPKCIKKRKGKTKTTVTLLTAAAKTLRVTLLYGLYTSEWAYIWVESVEMDTDSHMKRRL